MLFLVLNPLLYPSDLTVRMYVKLVKCFILTFMSFLNIELGHMEELQWEMLGETFISSFLDSWWLLYTQPVMSEGNTAHKEIRANLDAGQK